MNVDGIFLGLDPVFTLVDEAVEELSDQRSKKTKKNRLDLNAESAVSIKHLQSAQGETEWVKPYDFFRRISIGIRTCLLEALGFKLKDIKEAIKNPNFYKFYQKYRKSESDVLNDKKSSSFGGIRYVAGELDRLHPWLAMDSFVKKDQGKSKRRYHRSETLTGMAYIFYNDFSRLVEINTTIRVKKDFGPDKEMRYSCPWIVAECNHWRVKGTSKEYPDEKFMMMLKAMVWQHRAKDRQRGEFVELFDKLDIKQESESD